MQYTVDMNLYSDDIAYLKMGSDRQQAAFLAVLELDLFSVLADYDPLLTGTLPLGLDLPDSDLDVICSVQDFAEFHAVMQAMYGWYDEFACESMQIDGMATAVCSFRYNRFRIKISGQPQATREQAAYRRMAATARLLRMAGETALDDVRRLKAAGMATAQAVGAYFQLEGRAEETLAELANASAEDLMQIITHAAHRRN